MLNAKRKVVFSCWIVEKKVLINVANFRRLKMKWVSVGVVMNNYEKKKEKERKGNCYERVFMKWIAHEFIQRFK